MGGNDWAAQNQQAMNQAQGGLGYPIKSEPVFPRDAAALIAVAERRITEIDAELARVPELQAERERLARIVGAK